MSALLQQFDVVVVGAGVAGASAAYALAQSGARKIAVLDCGESGKGSLDGQTIDDTVHLHANRSGSAVMDNASPSRIKMIVQVYPKSSNLFIAHHGEAGARRYLRAARRGIELEKQLAARVGADIVQRGSLYVAEADGVAGLEEEFQLLTSLGCDGIELWNRERVQEATGGARAQFERGIYFPHDAIIDSSNYASLLLQHVASNGVTLFEHCSPVVDVVTSRDADAALTLLANGSQIRSRHAIVATGGLFLPHALAGLLTPCYSYLVGLSDTRTNDTALGADVAPLSADSVNMFTWGFTHDWATTRGVLRVSGADHFSALKPPHDVDRCAALASWAREKYPYFDHKYYAQYGVYSETPDSAPLLGSLSDSSRVHYLLGCNAWGQAILSAGAAMMPGLLGYAVLTDDERDELQSLSIRRFSLATTRNFAKL